MPLVFVQRYSAASPIASGTGVQTVTGTLTLGNPTIVEFDSALWSGVSAGTPYVIFTYGTLSGTAATDMQADSSSLAALGFSSASFSDTGPTNGQITVTFS